ncbi:cytochrome-c peroxidase [Sorangium sp. So ce1078]|uniref:cytochrome-c peroxidase n=1 Tax=Sorangium sp. So ce1078 TaxID=3133329 RepID=UPI003F60E284
MTLRSIGPALAALAVCLVVTLLLARPALANGSRVDERLEETLARHGFTGEIESTLESRLGRKLDKKLARLGRELFYDSILGLNDDNSCSGCHSATAGFADTQSISIGVENNGVVGPRRAGPRNQRRAPSVINTAFYPTLMWNSRFFAVSGDPFDNSEGFSFTSPEGMSLSSLPHLLTAQAFIPPTEITEMTGYEAPTSHDVVREEVAARVNEVKAYRRRFGKQFDAVKRGKPITYEMIATAIAEFELSLTFADAPIDRFARGRRSAMTLEQKRGALLFFGEAGCVRCHAVSGRSNEMFSDFQQHAIGVPQIAPTDDPALSNVVFDGPNADEDFGLEQVTGDPADRYKFRTSPLRNVALQPTFFHNGSFTSLEGAVRHHLDVYRSATEYTNAHLAPDLRGPMGPLAPVLAAVDPLLQEPIDLSEEEIGWLVAFVGEALLDPRATPKRLEALIPDEVPSGRAVHRFE